MKKLFYLFAALLLSQQIFAQHFTITTTDGHLIITDVAGGQDLLGITQNGNNIRFTATGRNYSLNGGLTTNFPVEIALAGLQSITINAGNGQDLIELENFSSELPPLTIDGSDGQDLITIGALSGGVASLTVNGGPGNDLVIMEGAITFAPNGNLDLDLQNDDATPGIDAVSFAANANILLSGTGTATVKVSKNVTFNTGSTLITVNGNLTVEANQQASPTSGNFIGVLITGTNTQLQTSLGGILTVKGKGGDDASGNQQGIKLVEGGKILGGEGANAVTVVGTGGASAGSHNYGVWLTDLNSRIFSLGGPVSVTGTGGGSGTSGVNVGVRVISSGEITSAGGNVTVVGQGGLNTTGNSNSGISVQASGKITSNDTGGNVTITGIGGGSGASALNSGIFLADGELSAGGPGTVDITGQGGTGTGISNNGLSLEGLVTSKGGNITLTGKPGGGTSLTYGIYMSKQMSAPVSSILTNVHGGNISIITNSFRIVDFPNIRTTTAGSVTIKPFTAGKEISIFGGFDGVTDPLMLSDLELDIITTGTLIIGDATSGDITSSIGITRPTVTNMQFVSGGDVVISGGNINTNGGTLLLDPGTSPKAVKPTFNGTDVTATTLSFAGDLRIDLNGTTLGDGTGSTYSQLNVVGTLNLTGVNLLFDGTYVPVGSETFTIVNNDGSSDAITGTFNGLAEGATIPDFRGSGLNAIISYTGGDGNDVVISVAANNPDYTITTTGNNVVITDVTGTGETLDISENSGNIRFNVTGKTYRINGGTTTAFTTPAEVPLLNKTSITVNTAVGNDIINVGAFSTQLPTLTINGGTGDDQVYLNGNLTLAANANLDLDLQNDDATPGTDAVVIASNAVVTLTGTGTATVKASKNLTVNTAGSLITQNGNLTVETNQQATPTIGEFVGIDINGGTLKVTGSGLTLVKGKGGTTNSEQYGIVVQNGGLMEAGSNSLTVEGRGGSGIVSNNYGVLVTGPNSKVTSLGGNVSVTGQGSGLADANNGHGVVVKTSGMITAGATGSVTVHGTGSAINDGSTFGIHVNGGTITSSGGNVSVTGQGGGNGNFFNNYGVYLESSGLISAGGTGTVTVQGTGGNGSQGYNLGIYSNASSITSANGNISLNGQAGSESSSSSNEGIRLEAESRISAGGTGSIYMEGTGSASSSGFNYGINIEDSNSQIITNNGNIQLVGVGGNGTGTATGDSGINVDGAITAGGTGTIHLQGTGTGKPFSHGIIIDSPVTTNDGTITLIGVGGADATAQYGSYGVDIVGTVRAGNGKAVIIQGTAGSSTGLFNAGVSISGADAISSTTGGTIQVTGIEGGSGAGILMESEGVISTLTNGGNISLITNSIDMTGTSAISTNAASSVILRPYTNGVGVDLGASINPPGGPLSLSDAELDRITAGTLQIGNANSGTITVSTAISRTVNTAMNLTSGGSVNFNASSLNLNGGNLSINAAGGINPTATGTDATVGTASFTAGNDLNIVINGTTADTDYRQLNVVGSVNLTGLDLVLSGSYTPVGGETFTLVNNDGSSDAIMGTFNGLAQGATLSNFLSSSLNATISYTGGDGNDVIISIAANNPDYTITTTDNNVVITDVTGSGETLDISENSGKIRFNVTGKKYKIDNGVTTAFTTPAEVPLAGKTGIIINTAVGNDVINVAAFSTQLPSLTINGGTGDDQVFMNGNITFAANANLDLNLQDDDATPGTDAVVIAAAATVTLSGTGTATVKTSKNLTVNAGGSLISQHGPLLVETNQQNTPTPGNFKGIELAGTVRTTGSGSITLKGKGGNDASGFQTGVQLSGSLLSNTGITSIEGTGGASTGGDNYGINMIGTITITAATGITLTGIGGGTGTGENNKGVRLANPINTNAFNMTITIIGTGGNTTGSGNDGIHSASDIIASRGSISLTGTAGNTLSEDISIISGTVNASATTTLTADKVNITNTASVGNATTGIVVLLQRTLTTPIHLGTETAGSLSYTSDEMNRIFANDLFIGNIMGGALTISATIAPANISPACRITLQTQSDLYISGGGIATLGGNVRLRAARIHPTFSGIDVSMGTGLVATGSSTRLAFVIDGPTANTGYTQFHVAGKVSLLQTRLTITGSYTPTLGETFMIINNAGTDPIDNVFVDYAEGYIFSNFLGSGLRAKITYVGGDGNDVVISIINPDYTITTTDGTIVITDLTGTGETLDISQNGENIRFNVTGKTYRIDGGVTTAFTTPAQVSLTDKTGIVVNTGVGDDIINVGSFSPLPSLTINGGTSDDQVNMNGDITFAANANLDLDLQNDDVLPGTDALTLAANANLTLSGTGTATVKVNKSITMNGGSSLVTQDGNISLITNSIDIQSGATVSTNAANSVTLRPYTDGVAVDLGTVTDPLGGPLSLTDAELDGITAGTINVGNTNSGAITISAAISRTANTAMNLISGGAVNLNASSLNLNGGNLKINAAGGINPTAAGTDATAGTTSFTSGNDLNIIINGTTADMDYRQLNVVGAVNLTGLDLVLTGSHTPVIGQTFMIVNNDGNDSVIGTFNGLTEGTVIPNFLGSPLNAVISYTAGDGNDIVLMVFNPLPEDFALSGGGISFCGTPLSISLAGSQSGVSYQLKRNNVNLGNPLAGTGHPLTFAGLTQAGTYTILATNNVGNNSRLMNDQITIQTRNAPTAYNLTGGGASCSGTPVSITLSNSQIGVLYQLKRGNNPVGSPVPGTGNALSFPAQNTPGNYTAIALTQCADLAMNNTVSITSVITPSTFTVTGGGTSCGTALPVGLSGSQSVVFYQLYRNGSPVGTTVQGTGQAISLGNHLTQGTYTIVATRAGECATTMSGSVSISLIDPPALFSVTGGGAACPGGVSISLSGSQIGIEYQLKRNNINLGSPLPGTSLPLSFPNQTVAGTYTIEAISEGNCTRIMSGNAIVTAAGTLPNVYSMTGGGSFCNNVPVALGLSDSQRNVSYQLQRNTPSGFVNVGTSVQGTGSALALGTHSILGEYRVVVNSACVAEMTGRKSITPCNARIAAELAPSPQQTAGMTNAFAQIMPNPVSQTLHLKVNEAKGLKVNVSLLDVSGRSVLQRTFVPETNQHQEEFEVDQLTNGLYFLRVNTTHKQATIKVVKVQ